MELPAEVVCHVLSYGANRSWLGQMRRVCQLWCNLIDSTPSLWARFTVLELEDTRITPAALHGLCERIVQMVRCSKALHHPITTLLTSPRGATVKSIHIEACDQIASTELGIEAIIANCPLLESFTFLSSNVKKEAKTPYTERVRWGSPFSSTLAPERAPLRLFRTNAYLPTESLLFALERRCVRVELSPLPTLPVELAGSPLLPGAFVSFTNLKPTFGLQMKVNVGPRFRLVAAKDWQTGRCFTVPARDVVQCSLLTLTCYQLLDLSRDRMTSLMDSEGDVREDVQVTDDWYHLLEAPFSKGANITLVMLQVWPGQDEVVFDMLVDLD